MDKYNTLKDFEDVAKLKLNNEIFGYYSSGADDEITLHDNVKAFQRYYLKPQLFRSISNVDTKCKILGYASNLPFGFAPSAMQRLAHPQGQKIPSRIAYEFGFCTTLSTLSTVKLAEIRESNRDGIRFLQLYINKNREITKTLIKLAEQYDFKALVITVDAQVLGKRINDIKRQFSSPPGTRFEILLQIHARMNPSSEKNLNRKQFVDNRDLSMNWEFVSWLRTVTKLPLVLKGICSVEDAILAAQYKVDAIWISNHGGRQLDTVLATADILNNVCKHPFFSKSNRPQIYVDSGVRSGSDIFKCLALGADYVFLGRPLIYSMTEGYEGVQHMVKLLKEGLEECMRMTGCATINSINRSNIELLSAKL